MKIVLLHLSDLHISSKAAITPEKIEKVANSLNIFDSFDAVILALSGDIANSGKENEYKLASKFVSNLTNTIAKKHGLSNGAIKVVVVPGNHDILIEPEKTLNRVEVIDLYEKKELELKVAEQLSQMRPFYKFAKSQGCFTSNDTTLFHRKIIEFSVKKEKIQIEVNMINSALFSSSDDKGIHYLPNSFYDDFKKDTNGSYSIVMMHHSPDWFNNELKNRLTDLINKRCQIALYGHEHFKHSENVAISDNNNIVIQSGGVWWNRTFSGSSFIAGSLDTTNRKFSYFDFLWNEELGIFQKNAQKNAFLCLCNTSGSKLKPNEEYIQQIKSSDDFLVGAEIDRYFVFPSVKVDKSEDYEENAEINHFDELLDLVTQKHQTFLYAPSGAGKTTLSKMFFLSLKDRYTTILCNSRDLSQKKSATLFKYCTQISIPLRYYL